MYITSFSAHIEPLTLEREMAKCNPARENISKAENIKICVNFADCIIGLTVKIGKNDAHST